jgi:very-short-patch-repair endonuclease
MRLSDFDDWARAHHGIITLETSELSRDAWYRAIKAGTIEQLHPHVARLHGTPDTPDTPEQRIIAAVAAVGAGALASHRSAARLWGIPRPDGDSVDVLLPSKRRDVSLDGVVVHRPRDLARLVPQQRFGIRCTNIIRTLLDLGAVDPDALHSAVGHAITTNLVSLDALEVAAAKHARPGRSGVVAVRDAIAEWSIDDKPADSVLEMAFVRLADRFGLPELEFHPMIDGIEVDFRVRGTPVVIECDGWAYHGRERRHFERERDRERDARLIGGGWIVLRFTYRAVITRPKATADRIRAAIDRWSDAPAPDAA